MNYKKTLLAVSLAGIITGCGGSDENSGTGTGTGTSSLKAQIIDGYLVKAEVYVDRNDNKIAEPEEKLEGYTDDEGYISLSESDKKHRLIARAVAGQTFDTDKSGTITTGFELAAPAGAMVLNPYTTLAVIEDKTIDDIASELNINPALISGDYVKAKSGDAADEAKKAHLVARSLVLKLEDNITQSITNAGTIKTELEAIQSQVETAVNAGQDLDKIIIKEGEVAQAPQTAKELLVGNSYAMIPTNEGYFAKEGIQRMDFKEDKVVSYNNKGEPEEHPITYTYSGIDSVEGHDEIIFAANDFYLSIAPQDDLLLSVDSNKWNFEESVGYPTDTNIENAQFEGKTLYHFWDDSTTFVSKPFLSKFAFGRNGIVTLSEKEGEGEWKDQRDGVWEVKNGQLIAEVPEIDPQPGEGNILFTWQFTQLQHDGLRIAYDESKLPLFFTENEELATSLYRKWLSLKN